VAVVLIARPDIGAMSLVTVVGFFKPQLGDLEPDAGRQAPPHRMATRFALRWPV
jgi:hypothetical protein